MSPIEMMIQSVLCSLNPTAVENAQKAAAKVRSQYEGYALTGPRLRMIAFDPEV